MHNCSRFPYLNLTFQYFSRLSAVFARKIFNFLYNSVLKIILSWRFYNCFEGVAATISIFKFGET